MVFLTLLGACAMICHHFLCTYSDGKEVLSDVVVFWHIAITTQMLMSVTGNAIAASGSIMLSAAIGIAAVQVLWSNLGQRSHSIRQIRAMLECRSQPFAPIAWPAWSASRRLTLLAVFSSLMTLITIFAPSSLRTEPNLSNPLPCSVKRVDLSGESFEKLFVDVDKHELMSTTSPQLRRLVTRNLVGGTYLTPPNQCNQSCSYGLKFNSPAMNCSDTTSNHDFSNMIWNSSLKSLVIWNSTHTIGVDGSTIFVETLGGLNPSDRHAFDCELFNATYSVDVFQNGSTSTVNVSGIERHQKISSSNSSAPEYKALHYTALTIGQVFWGVVQIEVDGMLQYIPSNLGVDNSVIIYATFGEPNPTSTNPMPWLWNPDMPAVLAGLVTNISISLLSNPMGLPMIDVQTTCRYPGFVYVYNPYHLFLTYGIGLVTAIFCLLLGFISIYTNKREETLHFSRLLVAILDPKLSEEVLTDETKLITENRTSGNSAIYSQFKKVY